MDADPAKSNIFGVAEKNPELALDGIRLRQFGQQIIERLGGKRIHPAWVVPGGVSEPLTEANRDAILWALPDALAIAERTLEWFKSTTERFREEISVFGNFPTLFMGIVKRDNGLTFYDGKFRIVDASGHVVADSLDPARVLRLHRRKSRALELPEVHLLQAQRISRRHLSRRPAWPG